MKILVLSIMSAFSIVANAQEPVKNQPVAAWQPAYYIDSLVIKTGWHFDHDKIKAANVTDLKVDKNYIDSSRQIQGRIYITLKEPVSFNFLSIDDINHTYIKEVQKPVIYMVDNEFVKDIADFKIDSSFILKVELTSADDLEYLKQSVPDLTILKIITRTKENVARQNRIIIRGTQVAAMN